MAAEGPPIRPAATVVLWREGAEGPEVLMGQRGAGAAFMPDKFVFPGGAVDREDPEVPLAGSLPDLCARRLAEDPEGAAPQALAAAAIRELWEETGLALARAAGWQAPEAAGPEWARLAAAGYAPSAADLRFVFRAITPPGRPRRFDARFFLVPAGAALGDAEGFAGASGELSHLHFIPLTQARRLDLPFITEVVLAEVGALLAGRGSEGVPFFDNRGTRPAFRRLA